MKFQLAHHIPGFSGLLLVLVGLTSISGGLSQNVRRAGPELPPGLQKRPDSGHLEILDVAENLVQQIEKIFQVCA